jgi:nucleotide-binding universal stress UspA family protein
MIKSILVAIDGSDNSQRALDSAIDLAKMYSASISLVHVVRHMQVPLNPGLMQEYEAMERQRQDILMKAGEQLVNLSKHKAESKGFKDVDGDITSGDPAAGIEKIAKKNKVDLIIAGRRGLGKESGKELGSVSRKLINLTQATCMLVK